MDVGSLILMSFSLRTQDLQKRRAIEIWALGYQNISNKMNRTAKISSFGGVPVNGVLGPYYFNFEIVLMANIFKCWILTAGQHL